MLKTEFKQLFTNFCNELSSYIMDNAQNWTVKGFIDSSQNIYTISQDTKIISKILEIHLFPELIKFAHSIGYDIILPNHQNYYPDFSFVSKNNSSVKFAVDLKTTYRNEGGITCNGFTLGSYGAYFKDKTSSKNIQFPYQSYNGHFCLGVIYDRNLNTNEREVFCLENLDTITAVISHLQIFFAEKWKIASDKQGSGNTANIGSIKKIANIVNEQGTFAHYSEELFDDYWINHKQIKLTNGKTISSLTEFLAYRGMNVKS